jgi:hypothetical protein
MKLFTLYVLTGPLCQFTSAYWFNGARSFLARASELALELSGIESTASESSTTTGHAGIRATTGRTIDQAAHYACKQVVRKRAEDLSSSDRVAVLIPFREQSGRERRRELQELLTVLRARAGQTNFTQFHVFIAEQSEGDSFNRGMLLNVAFDRARLFFGQENFSVVATDCDFVPEDGMLAWYSLSGESPVHLASYAYCAGFGGVTVFTAEQYRAINGYSNRMWGWGTEDDDAMDRWMSQPERRVIVPDGAPRGNVRFRDIGGAMQKPRYRDKRHYAQTLMIWRHDNLRQRWVFDGLSDLDYAIRSFKSRGDSLVEHIVVKLAHHG